MEDTETGDIVIVFTNEQDKSKNFSITLPKDAAVSMAKMILADA